LHIKQQNILNHLFIKIKIRNFERRTAGYIWTDYKTNAQIAKELKITPILDKLLDYKRNWIQHLFYSNQLMHSF
jgi:hypothetical protein